ncbi:hypothetical protein PYCCODRAFT_1367966 [Trametes coccinea BRFM310]|uniref:UbiA prenyltransferase n=1 Tax=Trametes coccinea (strain BRFM310) TaxID=1353009 RepID=A0A1Y2IMJ5_TRAC3|nr:hypothetical protein PYCCODRAFT_1367966 [Trametes coccinea BRFM310]
MLRKHINLLYALYLFTKSDIKTIFLPVTLFAWYSCPSTSASAMFSAALWSWMHLLQFCVSNQAMSPDEDAINKPWRPIPSGRITPYGAAVLRWTLLPLCFMYSVYHKIMAAGTIFAIGVLLHNECMLDSHWFTRNVLNALGYAVFDAGATAIAQQATKSILPATSLVAHYLSIAIVLTTIHAQDFQDEAGDRLTNRRTIPIVMPRLGRLSMLIMPILWSVGLAIGWSRSPVLSAILFCLGVTVGLRFYLWRSAGADRTSYILYNIWLGLARITPIA